MLEACDWGNSVRTVKTYLGTRIISKICNDTHSPVCSDMDMCVRMLVLRSLFRTRLGRTRPTKEVSWETPSVFFSLSPSCEKNLSSSSSSSSSWVLEEITTLEGLLLLFHHTTELVGPTANPPPIKQHTHTYQNVEAYIHTHSLRAPGLHQPVLMNIVDSQAGRKCPGQIWKSTSC